MRIQPRWKCQEGTYSCAASASLLAGAMLSLMAGQAWSNEPPPPVRLNLSVPLEKVTDIKSQPLALLAKFPQGGAPMAAYVAHIVANDPTAVDPILSVVKDASPQQAAAIGAGLARASRVIATTQPGLTQSISEKVGRMESASLKVTYQAIGTDHLSTFYAESPPPLAGNPLPSESREAERISVAPTPSRSLVGAQVTLTPANGAGESEGAALLPPIGPPIAETAVLHNGTIIAILASDASSSGATSTSPTN